MNKYIFIDPNAHTVQEIIPEFVDDFPGVPITDRYSPDFLKDCIMRTDEEIEAKGIAPGKIYFAETNEFQDPPPPPEPEPAPEPEPIPPTPTEAELLRAENNKLKAQLSLMDERQTMLEDCILEMADEVYA